jgi:hypothetical protein
MASRSPRPSRIDAAGRPQETDEAAIRNCLNVVHCLPENVAASIRTGGRGTHRYTVTKALHVSSFSERFRITIVLESES